MEKAERAKKETIYEIFEINGKKRKNLRLKKSACGMFLYIYLLKKNLCKRCECRSQPACGFDN